MTEEQPVSGDRRAPDTGRAVAAELAWDLACAHGALSEIATCWRRALSGRPELPLRLPLQLADAAHAIGVMVARLAAAEPNQSPALAEDVARRLAAFQRDIALARALTSGPDAADAGDGLLWESADHALHRAGSRLLGLVGSLG